MSRRKAKLVADVRPIGGMEKTKWAGQDMWRCPRCHGTTFNADASKVHVCKQPKFADESEAEADAEHQQ